MKQEFCKGVFVKEINLTTFSLIKVSVNLKEFQTQVNESGYINFDIKKSKAGKYYAVLNTWKPQQQSKPVSQPKIEVNNQDDFGDMPF